GTRNRRVFLPLPMKTSVLAACWMVIGSISYQKIGIERYCNVDPTLRVAQCNYESANSCLGYLEPGHQCVSNPDFVPTQSENLVRGDVWNQTGLPLLTAQWRQDAARNRWQRIVAYLRTLIKPLISFYNV